MAFRYLRASGNWNGPVWAATSGGAAGSASTPTASDSVFIQANFTVTLTGNAVALQVYQTAGHINLSSYKLELSSAFQSAGSTTRSINLGSGVLETNVNMLPANGSGFAITGSNCTLTAGTSTVILNCGYMYVTTSLETLSQPLNDVIINLGVGTPSNPVAIDITGSPTFRSLIIQSKNSAAHTVNFEGENITADKYIFTGSSEDNKLVLVGGGDGTYVNSTSGGTFYGQYVDKSYSLHIGSQNGTPYYLGSNSVQSGSSDARFLLQDPPKISTLVDDLTAPVWVPPGPPPVGHNPNWTGAGTINHRTDGIGGGGYSGTAGATLTSTDTYDLIGSKLVFERPVAMPSGDSHFGVGTAFTYSNRDIGLWSRNTDPGDPIEGSYANRYETGPTFGAPMAYYPIDEPMFVRIEVSQNGYFTIAHSDDGLTWTTANDGYLNEIEMLLLRSTRIMGVWDGVSHIGSINMLPAPPEQENTGAFFQFFH